MSKSQPTLLNWIILFTLGLFWGASFLGAKMALESFGPMTTASLRIGIGAAILLTAMLVMGYKAPSFSTQTDRRIWLHIVVFGITTNAIPFSLFNWGQTYVTSSFAGVSVTMVPLFALPMAHFLFRDERMTPLKVIGFVIGFIGTLILINPSEFFTSSGETLETLARLACVGATFCYAIGSMNTKLCPATPTIVFSALGLVVGAVTLTPIALYIEGVPSNPTLPALLGVIYLGIFPTALTTLMLVWLVRSAGPTFMSSVSYQIPFWAVFLGVVVVGEAMPPTFWSAFVIILIGLAISQYRPREKHA